MNYAHAFHAGNFADVLKHAVLVACLDHLCKKPNPFRLIDTHAGAGRYALGADASSRTDEWQAGIGRLLAPDAAALPTHAAALLAPYLQAIRKHNPDGQLSIYPGSPLLMQSALRAGDSLAANELHPTEVATLRRVLGRDKACRVSEIDGYAALKALLPPPEKRGLVLIDPPFEQPGELVRLTDALGEALERFATGLYVLWYPIKDEKPVKRFHRGIADVARAAHVKPPLVVELLLRLPRNPTLLNGCGLVVVNPPFTLQAMLDAAGPTLAGRLGEAGKGRMRTEILPA